MNYPITIVGGGLAGLSLSIALRRRGLEVELHEKRRYPFHRVCGEFISGVSREVLDDLGILGCLDGAVAITTMRWYLQDRLALEERLPRKALGLSRYTLDERLANHAGELGVRVQEGSGFRGQDEEGVVWASGKRLDQSSPWIGLSAHVENVEIDGLEMHCGPGGYLGISPVEAGRVNVTGLFRQSRSVKGRGVDLVFGYLEATGCLGLSRRLQEGTPVPESFAAIAGFDFGAQSSSGFRLGDRSRLIPPFAGNGMSMAFESAARAAPCLVEYAEGKTSWKEAQNRFRQFEEQAFATRMRMASCLHPILLSRFGLRLIGSLAAMGLLPTQRLFHSLR